MSKRITLETMKKALPPGTKGIAIYENTRINSKPEERRMTYAEFLKIPSKVKGKVKTATYWAMGHDDGPEFKDGFYTNVWMLIKLNGTHYYYFLAVEKTMNSGKRSYVSPTKKNSHYKDYMR